MNRLLVTICYHPGDLEITRKLLNWIVELGDCHPHSLLLAADSAIPQDTMREVMDIARPVFASVRTMIVTVPKPTAEQKVWAPNVTFLAVANQVKQNYKFPFLFLEPDAIPLTTAWLQEISHAYHNTPARFMGSIVKQTGQPGLPAQYLNGVAVYPNDAIDVFENIQLVKSSEQAFDIGSAAQVVPKSVNTPLIAHYYGTKEMPPVFVEAKSPDSPKNHVTLDFVPKGAVVFHRSKGGELINLLRKNKPKPIKSIDEIPGALPTVIDLTETSLSAPEIEPLQHVPEVEPPLAPNEIRRGPGRPKKVEAV